MNPCAFWLCSKVAHGPSVERRSHNTIVASPMGVTDFASTHAISGVPVSTSWSVESRYPSGQGVSLTSVVVAVSPLFIGEIVTVVVVVIVIVIGVVLDVFEAVVVVVDGILVPIPNIARRLTVIRSGDRLGIWWRGGKRRQQRPRRRASDVVNIP